MATVTFYNFSKRKNSTATPSGSGSDRTVRLKDNTSLYKPTFELNESTYPTFTYAAWKGLYYYVTDIVNKANNLYDVECELDPMGSAADDIDGSTVYVNRASRDYDIWLPDPELSGKQKLLSHQQAVTSLATGNTPIMDGTGCYILRVVGGDGQQSGGIDTFILQQQEVEWVLDFMFSDGTVFDSAWDTVMKTVFNPFQYVVSLMYTPISYAWMTQGAVSKVVSFGWWKTSNQYTFATYTGRNFSAFDLDMPSNTWGDFRDYDPRFTKFNMILPGGICVELPSVYLSHGTLKMQIVMDIITGAAQYVLKDSTGTLATFDSKLAFPVQIGQQAVDSNAIVGGVASAAGAFITSNPVALLGASGSVQAILQPNPSINGSTESVAMINANRQITLCVNRYESGVYSDSTIGRMVNHNVTFDIGSNNGFYKCANASISTQLPDEYKEQINSILNSGFFLE